MMEPTLRAQWSELARAPNVALVIGLEGGLASPDHPEVDRGTVKLLEALAQVGVQVTVVSTQPRPVVEVWRGRATGVWWAAESGAWRYVEDWRPAPAAEPIDTWIEGRLPGTLMLAIGDGFAIEKFPRLARYELAFAERVDNAAVRRRFSGAIEVRDFLWWLIEIRYAAAS